MTVVGSHPDGREGDLALPPLGRPDRLEAKRTAVEPERALDVLDVQHQVIEIDDSHETASLKLSFFKDNYTEGVTAHKEHPDHVQRTVDRWRQARPDLDITGKPVTGRVLRLSSLIHAGYREAWRHLDLMDGAFGVLAALRRRGSPYQLTPKMLLEEMMLTSGGLSLLLDRLAQQGLVERRPNPADGRSRMIALTPLGLSKVDAAMDAQASVDGELIDALSPDEQRRLTSLLGKLLHAMESPEND